tara:strand:+ start:165 stop:431 length:267 start_codon:yes stop_codon:yes gene_type:complete
MSVFKGMKRYRNRKHLVDLLGATEHALGHVIGGTGKYRGQFAAMPDHLQKRIMNLMGIVYTTNACYQSWLIHDKPEFAPDIMKDFFTE